LDFVSAEETRKGAGVSRFPTVFPMDSSKLMIGLTTQK
jgi:hypothetical protein